VTPEETLIDDIGAFCRDPLGYVRYAWPWQEDGELGEASGPHQWQRDVLNDIGIHLKSDSRYIPLLLAVSSGHGIGKSALISWLISWGMSTCEDCRVIVTAGTGKQLDTKTWPEVTKWFKLAINSHWWDCKAESICVKDKEHERIWRADAITWSEHNTEPFAGLHNKGKRILVIYDEASGIADKIWEVTSGALTDEDTEIIWVAFGNPTQNTGRFRECFGRFKHRWITRQIDSRTVPGTNKVLFDQWVEDYGEDSDYVRVRVRGEFPRAGATQFIGGDVVSEARKRDVGDQSKAYKIISVDVARFGDDQTVIGMRQGLKATILEKLRGQDTTQVAMRVMQLIQRENARACIVDGDGIGGGVIDFINLHLADWMKTRKWFKLDEFHGGATPGDGFMYFNRRAEMWGAMRDWLVTGSIPDDPELEVDLTGPEYFFSAKNQIQLEKKEDMKKRGLASPDCGDMLAMSFACDPTPKTREEALAEAITATEKRDPVEAHFMRLRETERRKKKGEELPYWM
jgi:hypothetical protein